MRRALVVAHPDDESLFFGGLVIANPGDWTIICCSTPRIDPVRAEKFFDACRVLDARGILRQSIEPPPSEPFPVLDAIGREIERCDADVIVTHNVVGEYGHIHHVCLNRFIASRWPDKIVTGGYGKAPGPYVVSLDPEGLARKLSALRCYDHVSPSDGRPKWQALLDRYGPQFDLSVETYDRPIA